MKTTTSELLPAIFLSLATAPLLITLEVGQALGKILTEVGQGSEEMFRGDRLPILHFSPKGKSTPIPRP